MLSYHSAISLPLSTSYRKVSSSQVGGNILSLGKSIASDDLIIIANSSIYILYYRVQYKYLLVSPLLYIQNPIVCIFICKK